MPSVRPQLTASFVAALPAIVLAMCTLVPWLGKAYTIDDTLFLRQAEHALQDPLHPAAFDYQWSESDSPRRLSRYMPSGPVMAYLLVPAVLLRNGEWLGHVVELLFLLAAAVALASIALRLGYSQRTARLAPLLLVASPVVLAMSATCMPDTVAMSLGLIGIDRILAWRDDRRWLSAAAAAVALAIAVATRSHCVMLLPPAFVFAVSAPGASSLRERVVAAVPVLLSPLLAGAVLRLTRDPVTGGDVASSVVTLATMSWRSNLFAFLLHYSLVLPLGAGLVLARRRLRFVPLDAMIVAALPIVYLLASRRQRHDDFLLVAAALALAALLAALTTAPSPSRSTRAALFSWLLAPLPVIFYLHLPAKFLVISAPAAALVVASAIAQTNRIVSRFVAGGLVVAGTVLGLLIVEADSRMAGLGREAAATFVEPAVRAGTTVWFAGHWGFQWYMEQAGANPVLPETTLGSRDLVLVSQNESRNFAYVRGDCDLLRIVSNPAPGGRIMAGGAGFYSNGWGSYPWVWSVAPDERIEIWRAHPKQAK